MNHYYVVKVSEIEMTLCYKQLTNCSIQIEIFRHLWWWIFYFLFPCVIFYLCVCVCMFINSHKVLLYFGMNEKIDSVKKRFWIICHTYIVCYLCVIWWSGAFCFIFKTKINIWNRIQLCVNHHSVYFQWFFFSHFINEFMYDCYCCCCFSSYCIWIWFLSACWTHNFNLDNIVKKKQF